MKKQLPLFILAFFYLTTVHAQVATLYAGLSGVVGKKGEIDTEILTQIIADKQQELKKEFARKNLMRNIDSGSYAFYTFAGQSFDIIFNTTNKTAAARKLIETSSNLALVYGFTEFYLQASKRLLRNSDLARVIDLAGPEMLDTNERKKWLLYLSVIDTVNGQPVVAYNGAPLQSSLSPTQLNALITRKTPPTANELAAVISTLNNDMDYMNLLVRHNRIIGGIDRLYNQTEEGFNVNTYLLDHLKPGQKSAIKPTVESAQALNFVLVDLVYDVLIHSEQVANLGFFVNENTLNVSTYAAQNKYQRYIQSHPGTAMTNALITLRQRINAEINLLFRTYTLLNDIAQKELSISDMNTLYKAYDKLPAFISSCKHLLHLQDTLAAFTPRVNTGYNIDTLATEADQLFNKLKTFLIKAEALKDSMVEYNHELFSSSDLLFMMRKAYPTLTKIALLTNTDKRLFNSLDSVYRYILYQHIRYIYDETKQFNQALLYQKVNAYSDFVELLTNLNDLDKAPSYEAILKVIQNAGAMFNSYTHAKVFNTIVNNIEKYTIINADENRIYVDVESIILAIYNKFANQENHVVDFYFSLGLNQSLSLEPDFKYLASDTLSSFGFAAEKIGLKFKIINIKKRRQYEVGEMAPVLFNRYWYKPVRKIRSKEPLISDVHLLVYGSGLLYNIVNTKTSSQFNSYLLGTGLGLSFYNGLDLNVSMNIPLGNDVAFKEVIDPGNTYRMFTFSLDIRIDEYLGALAQKKSQKAK